MSKTIVVIGVTGVQVTSCRKLRLNLADVVQGSSVADTFLSLTSWHVRGVTRDPSGPAARALTARGVEIVKADLDDKQSLVPAFEGAAAIYANTDYFGHVFAALASPDVLGGRPPNQYAFDRALSQNINIAEAAASPSVLQTLERFVYSSLTSVSKWSGGKYTRSYQHDVKARAIDIIKTQYPDLAARMSMLQVGHYVSNWQTAPPLRPQKQPDGSFVVRRTFGPDCAMAFIIAHKDVGAFAKRS